MKTSLVICLILVSILVMVISVEGKEQEDSVFKTDLCKKCSYCKKDKSCDECQRCSECENYEEYPCKFCKAGAEKCIKKCTKGCRICDKLVETCSVKD